MPCGSQNCAASPTPSASPPSPLPAIVVTAPVATSTRRIFWLPWSAAIDEDALLLRMAAVQPPACLADLNDDLLRMIDLAAPLVANAVSVTNEKWRDAASKIGGRVGAKITGALERNEVERELVAGEVVSA
ncbi:hypothetical protein EMIHUDRAFT_196809 [Emiliania huxleyi CCMP1516]|uniref:Uncharacterized protein n=2 Tax=Emiliania huxleyi TaxID=2903 RepID=A0A0D3J4R3_EMIH1|nr:hypothetical protein EMIHUDRAFT_196809 [Emiliania huxleyi CCMP1516]EOD18498.1 hypothetical protein EMIHUDRAFT_196809 [Emiliania huxleyi CCMP1516]|eukprot:XP_005770927.1 hypothetical protein EMIHUDRAFT_196809 [Emiliania huxleyi CCMP1516]